MSATTAPVHPSQTVSPRRSILPQDLPQWIEDLSMGAKLRLAITAVALGPVLFSAVILFAFVTMGSQGITQAQTGSAHVRLGHAAMVLAEAQFALKASATSQSANSAKTLEDAAVKAEAHLAKALRTQDTKIPAEMMDQIQAFRERARTQQATAIALGKDPQPEGIGQLAALNLSLASDLNAYSQERFEPMQAKIDDLVERISETIRFTLPIAALLIALCLISVRAILRNITEVTLRILDALEKLAAGDLAQPVPGAKRKDELGAMSRAINICRDRSIEYREVTAAHTQSVERELEQAKAMDAIRTDKKDALKIVADDFESSIFDVTKKVAANSADLRDASDTMVTLAKTSCEHADNAANAMEDTAMGIAAAASASDQFALSISEISQQAAASAELAREVKSSVDEANGNIDGLSRAVDEIGEIAEMIGAIASRTNLLSLNASIEAARGGEAGRGFAVVASEVKELASRTSHATNNVAAHIVAIQGTTRGSVEDLANVAKQVELLESSAVSIAAAVDQQSISGRELAQNIDSAASSSDNVSKMLEEVRDVSLAAGAAAAQMLISSEQADGNAEALKEQAVQFLAEVRTHSEEKATG
jgi:methyl-accepting chemotaxis protein